MGINYLLFGANGTETPSTLLMITYLVSWRFFVKGCIFGCPTSEHFYLGAIVKLRVLTYGTQSSMTETQEAIWQGLNIWPKTDQPDGHFLLSVGQLKRDKEPCWVDSTHSDSILCPVGMKAVELKARPCDAECPWLFPRWSASLLSSLALVPACFPNPFCLPEDPEAHPIFVQSVCFPVTLTRIRFPCLHSRALICSARVEPQICLKLSLSLCHRGLSESGQLFVYLYMILRIHFLLRIWTLNKSTHWDL